MNKLTTKCYVELKLIKVCISYILFKNSINKSPNDLTNVQNVWSTKSCDKCSQT